MVTPPSAQTLGLALAAAEARLVVCVGAGVSKSDPCELPLGSELAAKACALVGTALGPSVIEGVQANSLLSVADKVEAEPGGRDLLQNLLPTIDRFSTAHPNPGHHVLAALALEGAISIISTNWDNCIERASDPRFLLGVVVTDEDRSRVLGAQLLKVHGCATKHGTLLVSTEQLSNPPIWVEHEVGGRLADSVVIFVGLGDVADYVQLRLKQLIADVGHPQEIRVIAPSIAPEWDELLPDLSDEQTINSSADEFLDDLIRAYVSIAVMRLVEKVDGHVGHGDYVSLGIDLESGKENLLEKIGELSGLDVLTTFRYSTYDWPANQPSLMSPEAAGALLALCVLAASRPLARHSEDTWVFDGAFLSILLVREVQSYAVLSEARRRMGRLKAEGGISSKSLVFLINGHEGPLPAGEFDVIGQGQEDDVIDGALAGMPTLFSVESVLTGNLPPGWSA